MAEILANLMKMWTFRFKNYNESQVTWTQYFIQVQCGQPDKARDEERILKAAGGKTKHYIHGFHDTRHTC